MADTPSTSIAIEISPKHALPTEYTIMKEARTKASPYKETNTTIDVEESSPSNFHKIVAELFGTYILIFAGCAVPLVYKLQPIGIIGIATVWGLSLMAVIYALGHISGAHFNPAVTIAFAFTRKLPWKHVPMYVLSQLLGSTTACLTLKVLFHDMEHIRPTLTQYSSATTDLEAIAWEFIATFILMFTICGVATDHRAVKDLAGVAIGATLMFDIIITGPITGASMNPARSIGPAIISGVYKNLWVYIVAPILGATAAASIYSVLRPSPKRVKIKENTKSMYNELYLYPDP